MKRSFVTAGSAFAIFVAPGSCMGLDENSKEYNEIGRISDVALKAIEAAKPEFLKEHTEPGAYMIDVIETDHLFQVTFCLKSQEQTVTFVQSDKEIGKWPRCPGALTVEFDKVTLKIFDKLHSRD